MEKDRGKIRRQKESGRTKEGQEKRKEEEG